MPFVALFAVLLVVNTIGAVDRRGRRWRVDPSIEEFDELAERPRRLTLMGLQDVVFVFGAWIAVRLVLGATPPEAFGLRRVSQRRRARRLGGGVTSASGS